MATTYTLISSQTLGSSAASVTFSAIPSTFTDLVLKVSGRSDAAGALTPAATLQFNGDSTTNYSTTILYGALSGGYSTRSSSATQSFWGFNGFESAGNTTNTFASAEIYIPSYTASQNKPYSLSQVSENNSAGTIINETNAGLWRNTAAITSILLFLSSGNFITNSSFYLYGISNA